MRRRLTSPRGRTTPCLLARERGGALSPRGKTRRHLALPLEDEASSHSPPRRRGGASSPRGKMRQCLVPMQEDEVTSCTQTGR
ncbi:hypothetical protein GW17_00009230 [Ensete ventricosum]|nr:hypothetical protein GW17_00009230 [Ensete ventricosum]